jgi:signal transduction histidine kinase
MMQNTPPGTIIIVDDEIESMTAMRDFLSELGYQAKGYLSGRDAVKALQEHGCDLLMTDLMMPEMDGITLMKIAKEIDPQIICIMVTGYGTIQTAVEAMKEGAFDYITKPADWKILRLVLSRAMEVRRLMKSEEQMRISRDQWRAFAGRLAEAQERERQRIARELHDEVGQNLIALGMNLHSLRNPLTDKRTGKMDPRLSDSLGILADTNQTIRNVIADLRPAVLDDYGLLAAVQSHCDRFSKRTGLHVIVHGDEDMPRLPGFAEITLYRIFQEALTNVAKHAQAQNVSILLTQSDTTVLLKINDDGTGFDPSVSHPAKEAGTWGLLNMRERAEAIGGTLIIESAIGKGTRVIVEIPK